jgi:hypothetical protein
MRSVADLQRRYRDMDPAFLEAWLSVRETTAVSIERSYDCWQAVRHVCRNDIPGDIVECGVWRGGQAMLVAYALLHEGVRDRRLTLYDTFAGMPRPSERDFGIGRRPTPARLKWERLQRADRNEWLYAPLDEVRRNLARTGYPTEMIACVPGKVEDTLPAARHDAIALLRLDTDFYESTKAELHYLYPRLSQGGVLLIDDYGHWAGAKQAVDEYFGTLERPPLMTRPDYAGRTAVKVEPGAVTHAA